MIPAGDKYLVLRGCNGRFPVDSKVAAVLSSMPKDKEIFVKLYTPEFSGSILNKIGPGTVNAWKKSMLIGLRVLRLFLRSLVSEKI
jgi:hypothetical protein